MIALRIWGWQWFSVWVFPVILGALGVVGARAADTETVPADTCVVKLVLPEGATVRIDRNDYKTQRTFRFGPLQPGKNYKSTVRVVFPDGEEVERRVSIARGQVVRVDLRRPSDLLEAARAAQTANDGRPELVLQTGHATYPMCAALAPDSQHLATGGLNGEIILWDVATGRKLRSFLGHVKGGVSVSCVAFSPDGRRLLSGGTSDGKAILWDKVTGEKLRVLSPQPQEGDGVGTNAGSVKSVAFSPDGSRVLTGSGILPRHNRATLWETESGRKLRTFQPNFEATLTAADFGPTGSRVVTAYDNGKVLLWDQQTGRLLRSYAPENLSPDNIPAGAMVRALAMGPAAAGQQRDQILARGVEAVALSPDGKKLAAGYAHGKIAMWSLSTGQRLPTLGPHPMGLKRVVFSPRGDQLLCAGNMGTTLWDVADGRRLHGSDPPAMAVAFSRDSAHMLTGHSDGTASYWDARSMKRLWSAPVANGPIYRIAVRPDGQQGAVHALGDSAVGLWDLDSGKKVRDFEIPPMMMNVPDFVRQTVGGRAGSGLDVRTIVFMGFSDDSHTLTTASWHIDGSRTARKPFERQSLKCTQWDVSTGKAKSTAEMKGVFGPGRTRTISQANRYVFAGTPSRSSVWDLQTGQEICDFAGADYPHIRYSADFGPAGRTLLVCSGGNSAALIDVVAGKEVRTFFGHQDKVSCVALSPSGNTMVTGSNDKSAIVWDTATGEKLHVLKAHQEPLESVAYSPDGNRVLTCAAKEDSILWDVGSGAKLRRIPGGSDSRSRVVLSGDRHVFSPDGRLVQTWDQKHKWSLRSTETGAIQFDSRGLLGGPMAVAFGNDGKPLVVERSALGGIRVNDLGSGKVLTSIFERASGLESMSVAADTGSVLIDMTVTDDGIVLWNGSFERMRRPEIRPLFAAAGAGSAISPDGSRVVVAEQEGVVTVWNPSTGKKLHALRGHDEIVSRMAFSRDGQRLITSTRFTAIIWDLVTGNELQRLEDEKLIRSVAFSPDGRYVLTSESTNGPTVWSTSTAEIVRQMSHRVPETAVFAPDGKQVVSASLRTIVVWDAASGQRVRSWTIDDAAKYLSFGPHGKVIAVGHSDGAVTLWSRATGEKVAECRGHAGEILCVRFKPDGKRLMTGAKDGSIRIWDTSTGDELARLYHFDGGRDWIAVTPEGLFDGSAGGRENVMFRFGGGLNVVPVDRFFQDFYYPGLLSVVWGGEQPELDVELAVNQPPRVEIVSPQKGGMVETNEVTLQVTVTDQGGGIRGPWLKHNGARLLAPGDVTRSGKTIKRNFDVLLIEGENRLELSAASADGSWESEPAVMTFRYEKPLSKSQLHIVSVGVSKYADESMNLQFAAPDALGMAGLFEDRGSALYEKVNVTSLINEKATKQGILDAVRALRQTARPQDTVGVFLAGHGAMAGKQYYFLPHDFRRQSEQLDNDVRQHGLLAGDLGQVLASVPALRRMVVFDTGQSGASFALAHTARNPFAFRGAVERLSRAQGAFTIAAAALSEGAQEVPELEHGVLSYSLLAGLRAVEGGPLADRWINPSNQDRVAHVLEWFGFASSQVPQLTKRYFGQAQDIQHSSAGASFPVLPVPETVAVPRVDSAPRTDTPDDRRPPPAVEGTGQADLYLVSVGINEYAQGAMNLKYAANDAKAITDLFARRGSTLYRKIHPKQLLNKNATRSEILATLKDISGKVQAEDTLVVYLSGHGTMVGQRYYFIPHEFRRQADSFEDDIRSQGLAADVLGDEISKVAASKRLLIFDTCASGGALEVSRQGRDAFAFRGAIENLGQGRGVFTVAASSAGAEAQEIEELGHGVLTYALLAGLRAAPADGPLADLSIQPSRPDGRVDVLEWFSYASGHVPRLTKRYLGVEQNVQMSGQGRSFAVLPLGN